MGDIFHRNKKSYEAGKRVNYKCFYFVILSDLLRDLLQPYFSYVTLAHAGVGVCGGGGLAAGISPPPLTKAKFKQKNL